MSASLVPQQPTHTHKAFDCSHTLILWVIKIIVNKYKMDMGPNSKIMPSKQIPCRLHSERNLSTQLHTLDKCRNQ